MIDNSSIVAQQKLIVHHDQLIAWLNDAAYPMWSRHGIDPQNYGFAELLDQSGNATSAPRRARVQPRQIYSFAMAKQFGWQGDVDGIVRRGMDYFIKHYRRDDGLFRTLADARGVAINERALLYDQAFALLGFAAAAKALDACEEYEPQALALRTAIASRLRNLHGGFITDDGGATQFESNPHMHLLEACLAWTEVGTDAGWAAWVEELVDLAMDKFIQANGALKEFFDNQWRPATGLPGRIVEPGHQFEWAWLLLRCAGKDATQRRAAAFKLIAIGEQHGVSNGVGINSLLDDLTPHDINARLWVQTERVKAALSAARLSDQPQYWAMAQAAVAGLMLYFDTSIRGLWFDLRMADGKLIDAPSPASTFYHVIAAILELDITVAAIKR